MRRRVVGNATTGVPADTILVHVGNGVYRMVPTVPVVTSAANDHGVWVQVDNMLVFIPETGF